MISPICGTLLAGGVHSDPSRIQHSNDLTSMWQASGMHNDLSLIQHSNDLTILWRCVDCWNTH